MKVYTVYGSIYIILFKNDGKHEVRAFTDIYAAERFCKKVEGKLFIQELDSKKI